MYFNLSALSFFQAPVLAGSLGFYGTFGHSAHLSSFNRSVFFAWLHMFSNSSMRMTHTTLYRLCTDSVQTHMNSYDFDFDV